MKYEELLEKMTPAYVLLSVEADNENDARELAIELKGVIRGYPHIADLKTGEWSQHCPVSQFDVPVESDPEAVAVSENFKVKAIRVITTPEQVALRGRREV